LSKENEKKKFPIATASSVSLPPVDLATARSQINQSYKYFGSQLPTVQTKGVSV